MLESARSEADLTVVGDACVAEVELNELRAVQQTSPHHRVSHLGQGQPQHLQSRMILDELYFVLWLNLTPNQHLTSLSTSHNCRSLTDLQVRQARDEGSHAPTRDGRSVEAEILQLLKALQRQKSSVRHLGVAKRQLLQPAGTTVLSTRAQPSQLEGRKHSDDLFMEARWATPWSVTCV